MKLKILANQSITDESNLNNSSRHEKTKSINNSMKQQKLSVKLSDVSQETEVTLNVNKSLASAKRKKTEEAAQTSKVLDNVYHYMSNKDVDVVEVIQQFNETRKSEGRKSLSKRKLLYNDEESVQNAANTTNENMPVQPVLKSAGNTSVLSNSTNLGRTLRSNKTIQDDSIQKQKVVMPPPAIPPPQTLKTNSNSSISIKHVGSYEVKNNRESAVMFPVDSKSPSDVKIKGKNNRLDELRATEMNKICNDDSKDETELMISQSQKFIRKSSRNNNTTTSTNNASNTTNQTNPFFSSQDKTDESVAKAIKKTGKKKRKRSPAKETSLFIRSPPQMSSTMNKSVRTTKSMKKNSEFSEIETDEEDEEEEVKCQRRASPIKKLNHKDNKSKKVEESKQNKTKDPVKINSVPPELIVIDDDEEDTVVAAAETSDAFAYRRQTRRSLKRLSAVNVIVEEEENPKDDSNDNLIIPETQSQSNQQKQVLVEERIEEEKLRINETQEDLEASENRQKEQPSKSLRNYSLFSKTNAQKQAIEEELSAYDQLDSPMPLVTRSQKAQFPTTSIHNRNKVADEASNVSKLKTTLNNDDFNQQSEPISIGKKPSSITNNAESCSTDKNSSGKKEVNSNRTNLIESEDDFDSLSAPVSVNKKKNFNQANSQSNNDKKKEDDELSVRTAIKKTIPIMDAIEEDDINRKNKSVRKIVSEEEDDDVPARVTKNRSTSKTDKVNISDYNSNKTVFSERINSSTKIVNNENNMNASTKNKEDDINRKNISVRKIASEDEDDDVPVTVTKNKSTSKTDKVNIIDYNSNKTVSSERINSSTKIVNNENNMNTSTKNKSSSRFNKIESDDEEEIITETQTNSSQPIIKSPQANASTTKQLQINDDDSDIEENKSIKNSFSKRNIRIESDDDDESPSTSSLKEKISSKKKTETVKDNSNKFDFSTKTSKNSSQANVVNEKNRSKASDKTSSKISKKSRVMSEDDEEDYVENKKSAKIKESKKKNRNEEDERSAKNNFTNVINESSPVAKVVSSQKASAKSTIPSPKSKQQGPTTSKTSSSSIRIEKINKKVVNEVPTINHESMEEDNNNELVFEDNDYPSIAARNFSSENIINQKNEVAAVEEEEEEEESNRPKTSNYRDDNQSKKKTDKILTKKYQIELASECEEVSSDEEFISRLNKKKKNKDKMKAKSHEIIDNEPLDGLRRSKRTKVPRGQKAVYELDILIDSKGNRIKTQKIVEIRKIETEVNRFRNEMFLKSMKLSNKKKRVNFDEDDDDVHVDDDATKNKTSQVKKVNEEKKKNMQPVVSENSDSDVNHNEPEEENDNNHVEEIKNSEIVIKKNKKDVEKKKPAMQVDKPTTSREPIEVVIETGN